LQESPDPRERWEGGATLAVASLYRGDVGEARRLAALGAKTGTSPYERVAARLFRAQLEADLGRHEDALVEAEKALGVQGADPKLVAQGHAMRALSLTRLGRVREAEKSAAEVGAFLATIPPAIADPARLQFHGELALERGELPAAREALAKAVALLPQKAVSMDTAPVEVHFALARAALAAGDEKAARKALAYVVEAGPRRVGTPIPYVRSLALLAGLEEKAGRAAEARALYERYLRHWKHGQLDRAEVARAGQRLAALRTRPVA
jgi:tetratricopeptide (TPR) repeat protein